MQHWVSWVCHSVQGQGVWGALRVGCMNSSCSQSRSATQDGRGLALGERVHLSCIELSHPFSPWGHKSKMSTSQGRSPFYQFYRKGLRPERGTACLLPHDWSVPTPGPGLDPDARGASAKSYLQSMATTDVNILLPGWNNANLSVF